MFWVLLHSNRKPTVLHSYGLETHCTSVGVNVKIGKQEVYSNYTFRLYISPTEFFNNRVTWWINHKLQRTRLHRYVNRLNKTYKIVSKHTSPLFFRLAHTVVQSPSPFFTDKSYTQNTSYESNSPSSLLQRRTRKYFGTPLFYVGIRFQV